MQLYRKNNTVSHDVKRQVPVFNAVACLFMLHYFDLILMLTNSAFFVLCNSLLFCFAFGARHYRPVLRQAVFLLCYFRQREIRLRTSGGG